RRQADPAAVAGEGHQGRRRVFALGPRQRCRCGSRARCAEGVPEADGLLCAPPEARVSDSRTCWNIGSVGGGLPAVTRSGIVLLALALAGLASAADRVAGAQPVVVKGCDRLYYERPGAPQLIMISDLPLETSAHTAMRQMTQAIKLTLKDSGFRAGRFSIGYVICDDSGAAGTWGARRSLRTASVGVDCRATRGQP